MRVFKKYKKTGDIVGIYEFEKGFQVGFSKTFGLHKIVNDEGRNEYYKSDDEGELIQVKIGRQSEGTKSIEETHDIRIRTLLKDKNKIKDIVNTNCYAWRDNKNQIVRPKFLTLTFAENIQDLKIANSMFGLFIKRLNYHIVTNFDKDFIGCQYTTVIEFQDKYGRGAIHYHVLLYNMPLVAWSVIHEIWGYGGAFIQGFKDKNDNLVNMKYDYKKKCFTADGNSIRNVGAYISKTMSYMVKSIDDKRLVGQKCCFSSKKLKKPLILNATSLNKKKIATLESKLSDKNIVFTNSYENEYIGMVTYKEFNIKFVSDASNLYVNKAKDIIIKEKFLCKK